MKPRITRAEITEAIAKSLRDFGYPDVTSDMIDTIYGEFAEGKRFPDLSHGVIGGFAEGQLKDIQEALGGDLP